jgi:hypothetical protein
MMVCACSYQVGKSRTKKGPREYLGPCWKLESIRFMLNVGGSWKGFAAVCLAHAPGNRQ